MMSGKDAAPPHPGALSESGALAALVQSGELACRERCGFRPYLLCLPALVQNSGLVCRERVKLLVRFPEHRGIVARIRGVKISNRLQQIVLRAAAKPECFFVLVRTPLGDIRPSMYSSILFGVRFYCNAA